MVEIQSLPTVKGNAFQMRQLFQNLIDNGIKYGAKLGENPKVKIYCQTSADGQEILIQDNGPGIEEKYREKIFQPFQRLDNKQKGSGLGLAICKRIAEQHGWNLVVEGEVKKGATFVIKMPLHQSKPS
jgi:two-component system, LuxR family, sensor kinase FixL